MNRKNHASVVRLTSLALLAALVVVLMIVVQRISDLFELVKSLFHF